MGTENVTSPCASCERGLYCHQADWHDLRPCASQVKGEPKPRTKNVKPASTFTIIGLSGKMGVGKSTIAEQLLSFYSSKAVKLSFADLLKEEAAEKFQFPLEWCYSEKGKREAVYLSKDPMSREGLPLITTVRELLQWYGTDVIRKKDPDHWVKAMRQSISTAKKCGKSVIVIDDVRFPNEAYFIQDVGGFLVRIERGADRPMTATEVSAAKSHLSELAIDMFSGWDLLVRPKEGLKHTKTAAQAIKLLAEGNHE